MSEFARLPWQAHSHNLITVLIGVNQVIHLCHTLFATHNALQICVHSPGCGDGSASKFCVESNETAQCKQQIVHTNTYVTNLLLAHTVDVCDTYISSAFKITDK